VATTTILEPRLDEPGSGDHDRFAHYCRKADIVRATVTGEPLVALCGKRWTPTRDADGWPTCPTCLERRAAGWTLGDSGPVAP